MRNRKFHCGDALTSARTASIHSKGTQRPNRSAIEQTKTFLCPIHSAASSSGNGVFVGAFSRPGQIEGVNF